MSAVERALAAEAQYLGECNELRRDKSIELYGHAGAYLAAVAPDDYTRSRMMLQAAYPDSDPSNPSEVSDALDEVYAGYSTKAAEVFDRAYWRARNGTKRASEAEACMLGVDAVLADFIERVREHRCGD